MCSAIALHISTTALCKPHSFIHHTASLTNDSLIVGIELAETIATSVSISLPFIIIATVIVLVMVCGFIYRKNTPGE